MKAPEGSKEIVEASIRVAFPKEADKIISELKYDSLMGCYYFHLYGMYMGVEHDGYIHS